MKPSELFKTCQQAAKLHALLTRKEEAIKLVVRDNQKTYETDFIEVKYRATQYKQDYQTPALLVADPEIIEECTKRTETKTVNYDCLIDELKSLLGEEKTLDLVETFTVTAIDEKTDWKEVCRKSRIAPLSTEKVHAGESVIIGYK